MTRTLATIVDYGPGATTKEARSRALVKLDQGIAYYLEAGIEGQHFSNATVLDTVWTSPQSVVRGGVKLHAVRLDAEVLFS